MSLLADSEQQEYVPGVQLADENPDQSINRLWGVVKPDWARGVSSVLLAVFALICAVGLIATSGWLISRAWQQPPLAYLSLAIVGVRAFGIGKGSFKYFERLVSHSNALRGLTSLRIALVDRIAVVAPVGTAKLRSGDAMRRLITDVDNVSEYGLRVALPRRAAAVTVIAVVAFAAILQPFAAVVLLIGLLVAGIVAPMASARAARQNAAREAGIQGRLAATLNWQFRALGEITSANAQPRMIETVVQLDQQIRESEKKSATALGLANAIGIAAQGFALIGVILVCVPAVRAGQLDNGVYLATMVLLPLVAFESVVGLTGASLALAKSQASATRLTDILDQPDPVPTTGAARGEASVGATKLQLQRLSCAASSLEIRDLTIKWPGSSVAAVANCSFEIAPNSITALAGPSGVGKSTIAAALVRFIPYAGKIRLNGIELDQLDPDLVRKHIVLSDQQTYIFNNTIAENVRLAKPEASDQEIMAALELVGAGQWVDSLPQGIHTTAGQFGTQLSGGQKQRIALARIELAQPQVAIFDEPTAHLDRDSASEILDVIVARARSRTTLLISHSREEISRADSIVTLGATI